MSERLFGLEEGMPAPPRKHGEIMYPITANIYVYLYENKLSGVYILRNGHSISEDVYDFQPDILLVDAQMELPLLIFEVEHLAGFQDQSAMYIAKGKRYTSDFHAEYYLYIYDENRWYIFSDGKYVEVPDNIVCVFLAQPLSDLLILAKKDN